LPRGSWWTLYGDAELDVLTARIETASPNLAAALARHEQASAYRDQARAALYPSVTIDGSVERNRASEMAPPEGSTAHHYNSNRLGANASYEPDRWGRVRNTVQTGEANLAAADADLESARLSLQAALVDDYVRLRGLDSEEKLLQDSVMAYQKALDLTARRQQDGIASGLDVARARTQLQTARAQVAMTAAARAVLDEAGANYRATALGAFAEVEDNLALLDHYREAAKQQDLAVAAALQTQDYALTRYRAGIVNYLEVTTAQSAALQTRRDALALEIGRLRASVALIRGLGGGWTTQINPAAPATAMNGTGN